MRLLNSYNAFVEFEEFFSHKVTREFYPYIEDLIPRKRRRVLDIWAKDRNNPQSIPIFAIEVKTQDIQHTHHNKIGSFYLENSQREFIHRLLEMKGRSSEKTLVTVLISKFNICEECDKLDFWLLEVTK